MSFTSTGALGASLEFFDPKQRFYAECLGGLVVIMNNAQIMKEEILALKAVSLLDNLGRLFSVFHCYVRGQELAPRREHGGREGRDMGLSPSIIHFLLVYRLYNHCVDER